MKKNNRIILLALLLCAATAGAQQAPGVHKWYVGADIGRSQVSRDGGAVDSGTTDFDDTSTSYALHAGYRFSRFFALEGGYIDFGEFGGNGDCPGCNEVAIHSSSHGFMVNVLGIWPAAKHLELQFQLGGAFLENRAEVDSGAVLSANASGFAPSVGFGLAFPINDHFGLNVQWTGYFDWDVGIETEPGFSVFSEGQTEILSAGMRWTF